MFKTILNANDIDGSLNLLISHRRSLMMIIIMLLVSVRMLMTWVA